VNNLLILGSNFEIDYFEMYRSACLNKQTDDQLAQENIRKINRPLPAPPTNETIEAAEMSNYDENTDFFETYREQQMNASNEIEHRNERATTPKKTTPVPAPRKKFNVVDTADTINEPTQVPRGSYQHYDSNLNDSQV
jgi:hypothetical protein